MPAFDPPPGYDDMIADGEHIEQDKHYVQLLVDDEVGEVRARKPMPNSIPALAMAANSKLSNSGRADHLVLFVKNHLAEGEMDRVFYEMMTDDLPRDTIERIARSIATWGTARPTSPSSLSA